MSVWFDGSDEVDCTIQDVKLAVEDLGEHFAGVVSLMPGLSSVELVEQGSDFVTIRTNEGLMTRTGVSVQVDAERVVLDFDEEYVAGRATTVTSHVRHVFSKSDGGTTHRTVISDVEASGLLGLFYRMFGSSKTGGAYVTAYSTYLLPDRG